MVFSKETVEPLSRTALIFFGARVSIMDLKQATTTGEVEQVRELFLEYATWLGFSLCFQDFDQELATLPGKYAPPSGRLLLAVEHDQTAGCVALRQIDAGQTGEQICEMKRLYVRPPFRNCGLGHMLAARVIANAREIGYQRMRLDTLPGKMDRAIAMYRSFGFKNIAPYYNNPVEGAAFMELKL